MSGIAKGVKKVFKKVTKFVKRYWKEIVIAAAVVFTAGAALGYFGAAAGAGAAAGGAAAGATAVGAAGATAATTAAAGGTVFGAAGGAAALGSSAAALGGASAGALGFGTLATGGAAAGLGAGFGGGLAAAGSAAAAGVSLADTVGTNVLQSGGTASYSQGAAAVAPQAQVSASVGEATATGAKGMVSKAVTGAKNVWGGLSSFEKMQVLATGAQMASALVAPKEPEGEQFPMQEQFYGRDSEGKGSGIGFDFDPQSKRMQVPGGAPAGATGAPMVARPGVGTAPQPADQGGAPIPGSFIDGSSAASKGNPSQPQKFMSDEDLQKRLDFVQGGYQSGSYTPGAA